MQLTFADDQGTCYVIITARGIPVSGLFEDSSNAEVVLAFLAACEIKDEDLDVPYYADYPMEVNGIWIGFRTELAKKMAWLAAQPAWTMIVDALDGARLLGVSPRLPRDAPSANRAGLALPRTHEAAPQGGRPRRRI